MPKKIQEFLIRISVYYLVGIIFCYVSDISWHEPVKSILFGFVIAGILYLCYGLMSLVRHFLKGHVFWIMPVSMAVIYGIGCWRIEQISGWDGLGWAILLMLFLGLLACGYGLFIAELILRFVAKKLHLF